MREGFKGECRSPFVVGIPVLRYRVPEDTGAKGRFGSADKSKAVSPTRCLDET